MKRNHLIAGILLTASVGFAGTAMADCAAELAQLPGVSKDASAAPLGSAATPQTGGDAAASGTDDAATDAGKAGNLMPMGADPDVATSAEDAQAQSEGGKTAAEQAMGETGATGDADRQGAIDEARTALASGDEEACMAALQKLKDM
jgi:hypothetical protein